MLRINWVRPAGQTNGKHKTNASGLTLVDGLSLRPNWVEHVSAGIKRLESVSPGRSNRQIWLVFFSSLRAGERPASGRLRCRGSVCQRAPMRPPDNNERAISCMRTVAQHMAGTHRPRRPEDRRTTDKLCHIRPTRTRRQPRRQQRCCSFHQGFGSPTQPRRRRGALARKAVQPINTGRPHPRLPTVVSAASAFFGQTRRDLPANMRRQRTPAADLQRTARPTTEQASGAGLGATTRRELSRSHADARACRCTRHIRLQAPGPATPNQDTPCLDPQLLGAYTDAKHIGAHLPTIAQNSFHTMAAR